MTQDEKELIQIIRTHHDPVKALSVAFELIEYVNSLTQEEVEAIVANFDQITALAETVADKEVAVR